jgi:hypothetical protein
LAIRRFDNAVFVTLGFDDVSLLPNLMDFDESSENDK